MNDHFDISELRRSIKTSVPPHSTICLVREVAANHLVVKFRPGVSGNWVSLPATEIAWAKVLRQHETPTGEYSIVELGLHENHPQTEIAALEAQVEQLQDHSSCLCSIGADLRRGPGISSLGKDVVTEKPSPFPEAPCAHCNGLKGCAAWRCFWHCLFGI